jgi:hypothetical protein
MERKAENREIKTCCKGENLFPAHANRILATIPAKGLSRTTEITENRPKYTDRDGSN